MAATTRTLPDPPPNDYILPHPNHPAPRPFGLPNYGATCYLNSLVQSLISIPAFNYTILDSVPKNPAIRALQDIIKQQNPSEAISSLLTYITSYTRNNPAKFHIGSFQSSSAEAFFVLITEIISIPDLTKLFHNVYSLNIKCPKCDKITSSHRDNSISIQLTMNPTIICGCLEQAM